MKIAVILFCLLLLPLFAICQDSTALPDTVLFNSGRIMVGQVIDTTAGTVTIVKPGSRKHKKTEINKEDIFSIRYGKTGKEDVLYIYDTLVGHDFTVEEARKFIAGEQDARRGFHAIGVSVAAFSIGFASGVYFGSAISFGPPFLYAGIMTYPIIRVRHKSVRDIKNVTTDAYLFGYDDVARNKRTLHSFVWGGIGLFAGLVANLILVNNQ